MNDLISRQAAIDAIENTDWYHQNANKDMVSGANPDMHQAWYKAEDVYKALESVQSAQTERKKGIWQEITEGDCSGYDPTLAGYDDPVVGYVCSCCRYGYEKEVMGDTLFNFCPSCGAKMDGFEEE